MFDDRLDPRDRDDDPRNGHDIYDPRERDDRHRDFEVHWIELGRGPASDRQSADDVRDVAVDARERDPHLLAQDGHPHRDLGAFHGFDNQLQRGIVVVQAGGRLQRHGLVS